jgi:hypothetical protein
MEFLVLRNKRQVDELCNKLKERRLPFKCALQDIYPLRSLESNNYYWGIVLAYASEATGHTAEEIHEVCKKKWNFHYDVEYNDRTKQYEWVMGVKSTTILDDHEIWDYIFKCRVEFEIELNILIPLPNECMINELNFEQDKLIQKKL